MSTALRDLISLADAGNPGAACRLGSLLAQCGLLPPRFISPELVRSLRTQEMAAEKRGDLRAANQAAQSLMAAQARLETCSDIPAELYPRAHAYLRQAALAGQAQALVQYTRGESFPPLGMIDNQQLRRTDFDLWREEAPRLLQSQFQDGRPEAALMMVEAHSSMGSNLTMVTPPDPMLDHAYLLLAQRLFTDFELPEGWSARPPDPPTAAESEALARKWHRQHFQGRQFSIRSDVVGFERELVNGNDALWPEAKSDEPGCSDPGVPAP